MIHLNAPMDFELPTLVGDIISPKSLVFCNSSGYPGSKNRLILPQVQSIRDVLDNNCIALMAKDTELKELLGCLNKSRVSNNRLTGLSHCKKSY